MNSVRVVMKLTLASILTVLLLAVCTTAKTQEQSDIQLKPIAVPSKVFSMAGEAIAFQATGKKGGTQGIPVSLKTLQSRVGSFEQVLVFEIGKDGAVLTKKQLKVDGDAAVKIPATSGNRYLIYADLGERYRNSYGVACRLGRIRIPGELIPRICTQIFCGPDVFTASELPARVAGAKDKVNFGDLGKGPIGGLGGSGNVCEQCVDRTGRGEIIYPVDDCSGRIPDDPRSPSSDDVVYVHTASPGNPQIYKMRSDGSNQHNISNNQFPDWSPDVRHPAPHDIVFTSFRTGNDRLYTMDVDGNNQTPIPNTERADYPKWNRGVDEFVVFTHPAFVSNSAIWHIRRNGTNPLQITSPGTNETDEVADVINDKFIIFSRLDTANNYDRDLYTKYIWDSRPPDRLTSTPNESETLPVISHDGIKIAYRVSFGTSQDAIRVATLNGTSSITVLNTIHLGLPADINISGVDFSADDIRLYISTQANDVAGNLINIKQEIFSVKLDGTDQHRLTMNNESDVYPSAVPH